MSSNTCINCVLYSWREGKPKDGRKSATLLKCSKCKFVYYCSKQCQLEHWEKVPEISLNKLCLTVMLQVHSAQCKYLAGVKALPLQKHEDDKCPGCVQESPHTRYK